MCFIPMDFSSSYFSISNTHIGIPFEFSPTTYTKLLSQTHNIANTATNSNGFYSFNLANNLKMHNTLYRTLE